MARLNERVDQSMSFEVNESVAGVNEGIGIEVIFY